MAGSGLPGMQQTQLAAIISEDSPLESYREVVCLIYKINSVKVKAHKSLVQALCVDHC